VDIPDNPGLCQRQQIVVAPERLRVMLEPGTAVLFLCQPVTLYHRPHCAVKDKYPPGKRLSDV